MTISQFVRSAFRFDIIIRNVPCLECVQCGDAIYTDEVATRLDEIVQSLKNFMGEIAVVEYSAPKAA